MSNIEIETLDSGSHLYPRAIADHFGPLAAPRLYVSGNTELMLRRSVGFCGSRHASAKGLAVAETAAKELAEEGATVVSGYAPGVDMAAHTSALRAGGETIVVLPEGISHFRVKKAIQPFWDWDRTLVVSQFEPKAVWRADRAMERNALIVLISQATIVIEAGETGGTMNAGLTALRAGRALFVANYEEASPENAGNQLLLSRGGMALNRSRTTEKPDLRRVWDILTDRNTGIAEA